MTGSLSIFDRLDARIMKWAAYLAHAYGADALDVSQEMWVAILERSNADPTFAQQTDSYIVQAGEWAARDNIRKRQRRTEKDDARVDENCDGMVSADSDTPERIVVANSILFSVVTSLTPDMGVLILGLLWGYSRAEIADTLGRSRAWATRAVRRARLVWDAAS